jgi:hypothetical protein
MSEVTKENQAVPLVLFSGGLDSTAVLEWALKEYRRVDVLSFEMSGQPEKSQKEEKARRAIFLELSRLHAEDPKTYGEIGMHFVERIPGLKRFHCSSRMPQMAGWLGATPNYVSMQTNAVYVGTVLGDTQGTRFTDAQWAWSYLCSTTETTGFEGQAPQLEAPYRYKTKNELLELVSPSLLQHVQWCEGKDEGDCGKCDSCLRMLQVAAISSTLHPEIYDASLLKDRLHQLLVCHRKTSLYSEDVSVPNTQ